MRTCTDTLTGKCTMFIEGAKKRKKKTSKTVGLMKDFHEVGSFLFIHECLYIIWYKLTLYCSFLTFKFFQIF